MAKRTHPTTAALLAIAAFAFGSPSTEAFTIQFDYTLDSSNFFAPSSAQRDRLEDAGAFFESIIGDDLDAITPGGGNSWTVDFEDPSNGFPAVFFNPGLVSNPTIAADTIVVYVGARNLGVELGKAAPGGIVAYNPGAGSAWETNLFTRGEGTMTTTTGASATDFAPWGGSLAVNSSTNWDYSLDGSTLDPTEFHFYSLLIHELAHVLGVGISDSWDANVSGGQFTGAAAFAANGNANVNLAPDNGHWVEGTSSPIWQVGGNQETSLDPTLAPGETKFFTELDVAALEDIGWEIVPPVPEPGVGLLAGLAGLGLLLSRRRR